MADYRIFSFPKSWIQDLGRFLEFSFSNILADFKSLDLKNPEFYILADFKNLAFLNSELKILADLRF